MDENVTQFLDAVNERLDYFIDRVFQLSQENLVRDGKIDTSTLLKTATINREYLHKEIIYPVIYADVVEYGRSPGTGVPPGVLDKWVKRKLGVKDPKEIKRTAFLISRAIKERGIQPSPYLMPAAIQAISEVEL